VACEDGARCNCPPSVDICTIRVWNCTTSQPDNVAKVNIDIFTRTRRRAGTGGGRVASSGSCSENCWGLTCEDVMGELRVAIVVRVERGGAQRKWRLEVRAIEGAESVQCEVWRARMRRRADLLVAWLYRFRMRRIRRRTVSRRTVNGVLIAHC